MDVVVDRRLSSSQELRDFFNNVRSICVLKKWLIEGTVEPVTNEPEM